MISHEALNHCFVKPDENKDYNDIFPDGFFFKKKSCSMVLCCRMREINRNKHGYIELFSELRVCISQGCDELSAHVL